MVTRRPRDLRRRPSEEAVRPFPRLEATPPVTKMCFAKTFSFAGSLWCKNRPSATVPDDSRRPTHPERTGGSTVGYGAGMTRVETVDSAPATSIEMRFAHWRSDALVLAIATVVIRLPAFFAEKSLV